jgi:hypothetical protein
MPKFTIKSPDGATYVVNAPEGATEAQALKFAQTQHATAKPAGPPKRTALQTAGDFAGDVVDNFLPNWGDEIAAIPDAAKAAVTGKPIGAAFAQGKKDFKSHQAQYDKEHGNLAWASTIGGLGASLALPAGRVAGGASMLAKVAHGAAVGAGYGAVSGAGAGEGAADTVHQAVRSAGAGALTGGLIAPATTGALAVARRARNIPGVETAARTLGNIPRAVMRRPLVAPGQRAAEQADRFMADTLNTGHVQEGMGRQGAASTPEVIAGEVQRRANLGVPAMPADVTPQARNLTSWASRGMGPGQSRVLAALEARKAEESARARRHVINTMGDVGDPIQQMEQHVQAAKARAAPAYQEAYAQPMVVTPEIEGIMRTPAFQDALPHAVRNIRNAQRNPTELGFRLDADGNYEGVNTLTTEAYDQVTRAMRDSGRAAMDKSGFKPVDTTDSVHINNRARDLRDNIMDQNEPYREAVTNYGDDMTARDAFMGGQDVRKLTGHEVNEQRRTMPQGAQGSWAAGARTALADDASAFGASFPTGNTAAHIRKALGDEVKQDAIGQLDGNTGSIRNLQDRLEAEHQGNITWAEVNGNSKTASRQALDEDLDAATKPLSNLSVRGVAASVINNISSRASSEFRNQVKARIADVMAETNPATVRDLMAEITARAQRDNEFAGLLHRSGILATKAYGANIVPDGQ